MATTRHTLTHFPKVHHRNPTNGVSRPTVGETRPVVALSYRLVTIGHSES